MPQKIASTDVYKIYVQGEIPNLNGGPPQDNMASPNIEGVAIKPVR